MVPVTTYLKVMFKISKMGHLPSPDHQLQIPIPCDIMRHLSWRASSVDIGNREQCSNSLSRPRVLIVNRTSPNGLWNFPISSGYHLVICAIAVEVITMLLRGKPSISIGAIYTMAMLNNQRVYPIIIPWNSPLLTIKSTFSYGKSPFSYGKSPFSYGKSPFSYGK